MTAEPPARYDLGRVPHHEAVRHRFEERLNQVRQDAVALSGLVLENARRAGEAMLDGNLDLAQQVIDADDEVDERYEELERSVFETLARQQPVAGDLRFLVAMTRMLYEIERTGDLVVNCAKAVVRSEGLTLTPHLRGLLSTLTTESSALWARSLDVLAELDAEGGAAMEAADDVVDEAASVWFQSMGEAAEAHGLENAILLSRLGRFLERIGDHAVNIGQHVTYIVTGSFPEDRKAAD